MNLNGRRRARPVARSRGQADWFSIRNVIRGASAEIYIYDEIGYWGTSAERFVLQLAELDVDTIELHINSPGGDVYDGIAIYQALRAHRAFVRVTVDSLAASAASFIAMAGDEIIMGEFADMMIHDGFGLCVGNASDMRDMAERLDAISDKIAAIYAERAGGEVSDWRTAMLAETWYSAEEAVTAKLADSVTPKRNQNDADMVEAENSWDLTTVFKNVPERRKISIRAAADLDNLPKPRRHPQADAVGLGVVDDTPVPEEPEEVENAPAPVDETRPENAIQNSDEIGDLTESDSVIQSDTAPEESDSSGEPTAEEVGEVAPIDADSFREALKGAFA